MIMSSIDGTIVATALPTIAADLGNEELRSWVITTYLLALIATMPLYGKLGDLYGRKRMYITAISIFTAGSMLCGAAGSMEQLLAARFIQGVGAGGIGALAMAIVADIVPARQLGRWLGYQGAIFACSSLVGPLTGGLFVDNLSWHWAFYVNVPFAAMSIIIVATQLHVPYQRIRHKLDVIGAILLTSALACIVLAASIGGRTNDWTSPEVLGLLAAVVVLVTLFVRQERRAPEPVLPFRVMGQKVVRYAGRAQPHERCRVRVRHLLHPGVRPAGARAAARPSRGSCSSRSCSRPRSRPCWPDARSNARAATARGRSSGR